MKNKVNQILVFVLCAVVATYVTACKSNVQNKETSKHTTNAERLSSSKMQNSETTDDVDKAVKNTDKSSTQSSDASKQVKNNNSGRIRFSIDSNNKLKFSAKTLDGKAVDEGIFKDYKLTMINMWGTLCKPCIGEMPDIEKVYEEMKTKKVNVIGFVANSMTDTAEKAKIILKAKGATYTNIAFFTNKDVANQIAKQSAGFPGTIFVDSKGNIVGKQISGTRSKEEYEQEIMDRLDMLGK